MPFAIITEKHPGGNSKTIRSTIQPPTIELLEYAKRLDEYLSHEIPKIEKSLIGAKLLDEKIPSVGSSKSRGNVLLWHELGRRLKNICEKEEITGNRERRWLWEAIGNNYATERIKRISRGKTRHHFEYCYRLSKFPKESANRINWSEWVYFFDSRTVREEQRIDDWLKCLIDNDKRFDRTIFRRFTETLNARVKRLDTSVLNKGELFAIYNGIWQETKKSQKD